MRGETTEHAVIHSLKEMRNYASQDANTFVCLRSLTQRPTHTYFRDARSSQSLLTTSSMRSTRLIA